MLVGPTRYWLESASGDTVELRELPYSLSYEAGAERLLVARVMTSGIVKTLRIG